MRCRHPHRVKRRSGAPAIDAGSGAAGDHYASPRSQDMRNLRKETNAICEKRPDVSPGRRARISGAVTAQTCVAHSVGEPLDTEPESTRPDGVTPNRPARRHCRRMQRGRMCLFAASFVATVVVGVSIGGATVQPGQPGQAGQSGGNGQPGRQGQPGQPGQPGTPGSAGAAVAVIGSRGSNGESSSSSGSGTLDVMQANGVTRVNASCSDGSGSVDFGDGTSAALSSATGTVTHEYTSSGSHRVTLRCAGTNGQSASTSIATVKTPPRNSHVRHCRLIIRGKDAAVLERLVVRLGFGVCHR